jgi:hypothetical protein
MVVSEVDVVVLPVLERMVLPAIHVRTDRRSSIVMRRVVHVRRAISRAAVVVPGSLADVEPVLGAVAEAHFGSVGRKKASNGSVTERAADGEHEKKPQGQASDQMTYDVLEENKLW